jgi:glutathione S-transferase
MCKKIVLQGESLHPPRSDLCARALMRLQVDYISRTLVPSFYRFLQAQDTERQMVYKEEFSAALERLASLLERVERPPRDGSWDRES